jgi:hypothetical protein
MKSSKEMDIDNSKLVVSLYNESKPEFWFLNGRWIGLMNSDSGRIPEGFKSSLDLFLIIEYYNDLFKKTLYLIEKDKKVEGNSKNIIFDNLISHNDFYSSSNCKYKILKAGEYIINLENNKKIKGKFIVLSENIDNQINIIKFQPIIWIFSTEIEFVNTNFYKKLIIKYNISGKQYNEKELDIIKMKFEKLKENPIGKKN